ncbi:aspartic proteinase 36 isoform X2 [Manihot esculenta]|uniref:aspartic proteinase 36 isoform X2 n=1 Tax=Manihot esculenta TaxID=3983 RepID=UPI001CC38A11|nr:aspartic proteinase 36 isoform X2 [Manihot esculenta]
MDLSRLLVVLTVVVLFQLGSVRLASGNFVFEVQHKFAGRERSLSALKAHDARRHRRILSSVDLPLGGNGHPAEDGLYFAKIGLGNPPKDYYVQVDSGSDILWVNCANCDKCPTKSDLGVKLTLYDPASSASSSRIYCADDFCAATYNGVLQGCTKDLPCQYSVVYGDGSGTAGFFVKDDLQFQSVTGDHQTASANGSVIFGCGAKQSGELGTSSEALDGILGFGQANSSMLSQLAAAGKVKKMFAHCLDNVNGGGIFAIGEIVSPKVKTTPMVANRVDDGFPVVKFHFEDSLTLSIYPHEYLFQIRDDVWCVGWQNSGMQSKDARDMTLLGDLVFSNKLVLYDMEKQAIGWTEYNCSSSIKVKDEISGAVYSVGHHNVSAASQMISGRIITFLVLAFAVFHRFW